MHVSLKTSFISIFLLILFINSHSYANEQYSLEDAFKINSSGILSQRIKMAVIAENVANVLTLKDEETGLPYQKKYVVMENTSEGVKVTNVSRSNEPFGRYYDPAAPQADENGYFYYPNVNLPNEMVNMNYTESVFDANATAFKVSKSMYQTAIELMK